MNHNVVKYLYQLISNFFNKFTVYLFICQNPKSMINTVLLTVSSLSFKRPPFVQRVEINNG